MALLLSQFLPVTFGALYFIANCPFYILAWKRFGRNFAISSAFSGALVSVFADHLYLVISLDAHNEIYCAIAGGLLMGLGMLILFRHRSSLGGFNVLCLYIQDRYGISVGKTQMAIDACNKAGKYIGICGQGPSDHPDFAQWLMQQGIDSVSLNPDSVLDTWFYLAGKE